MINLVRARNGAFNGYHSVSDTQVAEIRVWGLASSSSSIKGGISRNEKYFVC